MAKQDYGKGEVKKSWW